MGRYDITGPIADVNFMGYALMKQIAHGIHLRQFSRAFVISSSNSSTQMTFVSIDACMGTQIVKQLVLERLINLYPGQYSESNLMISATHTH
ncbi:neutral/alkaline non-lysosomal ceramidase N-terminal domain-containing protein, partial [Salmonella sp. s51228]|uniref:neutral/alkaline non-lysosomal ceramidase N-terminal domain-containing protein n=1 Tax=Salmonella sp. s51228 TaxID=3159652 RepID=UPI003980D975